MANDEIVSMQQLLDENASLRAQLVSCEGQWSKEVDANTVTRAELADAREALKWIERATKGEEGSDWYHVFEARKILRRLTLPAPAAEGEKPCGFPNRHNNPAFPDGCPDCSSEKPLDTGGV